MTVSSDKVASIYDATRWSGIPAPVMEKILSAIRDGFKDCKLILDVGVGTGRFAQYFNNSGFTVVGIDVSQHMIIQARANGVRELVRADADYLPFRSKSFDGSLMIHVLHLVKDWLQVVHEVGRVTRKAVISEAGGTKGFFFARRRYLELRAEIGYPQGRFNDAESGLRKLIRPRSVVSAGDYWTDVNADEEIAVFEARKSSVMRDVPDGVDERIMQRLREEYGGKMVRRHDVLEVISWDPAQLRGYKS
jgi:SAM-dependent methyltransferase